MLPIELTASCQVESSSLACFVLLPLPIERERERRKVRLKRRRVEPGQLFSSACSRLKHLWKLHSNSVCFSLSLSFSAWCCTTTRSLPCARFPRALLAANCVDVNRLSCFAKTAKLCVCMCVGLSGPLAWFVCLLSRSSNQPFKLTHAICHSFLCACNLQHRKASE